MEKTEIATLLQAVRVVDNRKVSQEVVEAWHDILKDMTLEVALEAHRLARRDASIDYLEPRHLWSWAKEARINLQPQEEPSEEVRSVQPTCRAHGVKITECAPCCAELAKFAEEKELDFVSDETKFKHSELIHRHASANLYV